MVCKKNGGFVINGDLDVIKFSMCLLENFRDWVLEMELNFERSDFRFCRVFSNEEIGRDIIFCVIF